MTDMSVKIGHASIDERGKGRDGRAGDQSGREVCVREWYPKGWTVNLRPKSVIIAEKSATACEKICANKNVGYDMDQRNTLHTQAKSVGYDLSKIDKPCETDCSALMTLCAIAAGVTSLEYTGNAPTTSTMRRSFAASGAYEALTDSKYLTTDAYLRRGDILVAEGHHTVMVLEDGQKVSENQSYYPAYIGKSDSLVDALSMMKIDSSKKNRAKIAAKNGIMGYTGSASQNIKLLSLLKNGKLKKG